MEKVMHIEVEPGKEYQSILPGIKIKVQTFKDWADEICCTITKDGNPEKGYARYTYGQFCSLIKK